MKQDAISGLIAVLFFTLLTNGATEEYTKFYMDHILGCYADKAHHYEVIPGKGFNISGGRISDRLFTNLNDTCTFIFDTDGGQIKVAVLNATFDNDSQGSLKVFHKDELQYTIDRNTASVPDAVMLESPVSIVLYRGCYAGDCSSKYAFKLGIYGIEEGGNTSGGLDSGSIIRIVIGVLSVIPVTIFGVVFCCCYSKARDRHRIAQQQRQQQFAQQNMTASTTISGQASTAPHYPVTAVQSPPAYDSLQYKTPYSTPATYNQPTTDKC